MTDLKKYLLGFATFVLPLLILFGCGEQTVQFNAEKYIPKGLIATAGTRVVELDWNGVPVASGYTVYWSNSNDVSKSNGKAIYTQIPHIEHRDLANNVTYYYVVTAHTEGGESVDSKRVEGTPQPAAPAPPENVIALPGDERITISWNAVANAPTYQLFWSTLPDVSTDTAPIENVRSPYVHSALINGQNYYYKLMAINQYGQSTASGEFSAIPQKQKPTAPVITGALISGGKIELQWQDNSNATSYELLWSTQGDVSENDAYISHVTSPFIHAPLAGGQTYYYRIRASNSGGTSSLSNMIQATPPDTESLIIHSNTDIAPAVPQNVKAQIHDGQVTLTWTPSTGASGYNVLWKSETGGVTSTDNRISNIQSPYTHTGLNNGSRYYYAISAINDGGQSALSTEIHATPEIIIPGVPTGVSTLAGDGWVAVRWTEVAEANSYNVYVNGNSISDASSPQLLTGLENGTSYSISVASVRHGIISDKSDPPVITTPQQPPPNIPLNVVAQSGDEQVTVMWNSALPQDPSDPGEVITEYRVYYSDREGVSPGNGTWLNDVTPSQNSSGRWQIIHSPVKNGQRYYYVVTASNAVREGRPSQKVWARPQIPIPGAPSQAWAAAGDNQVTIHFTPLPEDNAASYNLYWRKQLAAGEYSDVQVITNIANGEVFTDGNANGVTYEFQVSAFNEGGESARTAEFSATPQVPPPQSAPQLMPALAQDSSVSINWSAVADASLGYAIYWSTEGDIDASTSNRIAVENDQAQNGQLNYQHVGLTNGHTYVYQVAAINPGGESALLG